MTPAPGAAPGSSPLESASVRRAEVERAVGVLMVTEDCGEPVALVILRERAHVVRLSLPDFATALIVAVAAGPPPGDATPEW